MGSSSSSPFLNYGFGLSVNPSRTLLVKTGHFVSIPVLLTIILESDVSSAASVRPKDMPEMPLLNRKDVLSKRDGRKEKREKETFPKSANVSLFVNICTIFLIIVLHNGVHSNDKIDATQRNATQRYSTRYVYLVKTIGSNPMWPYCQC